ncbi:hypothetical protein ACFVKC_31975 [Streptomyces noursei]|uniref:hypothetical protein n=1 Tax=Streptomyces noursei TaxID=1971 RepID=UPI0036446BAC
MSAALPRTIRAVDSDQLLLLEEEASRLRFSQRLPADWLREHIQAASAHYLFPVMEHWLAHRPDASPQWRCELLLMVRTGEEVFSLMDVRPGSFEELAETLDTTAKTDIAARMKRAISLRTWAERQR